jgi:hypothetical protein
MEGKLLHADRHDKANTNFLQLLQMHLKNQTKSYNTPTQYTYVGLSESNASYFLFHATYKLDMSKLHRTLLQLSWRQCYFKCSLHLCQQTSSTLE